MAVKSLASVVSVTALMAITGCGFSSSGTSGAYSEPAASESAEAEPAEKKAAESKKAEKPEPDAEAEDAVITITGFVFEGPETVAPGATVTVVNEDPAAHTVTSKDKAFTEANVEGETEATFTAPTEPGEYAYFCKLHPDMEATLVVE